jgi:predicted MFS family arabinose efflux permease
MVFSPQIGRLSDRLGAHRALMLLFLVRAVGYGMYLVAKPYWAFIVLSCLVSTADRSSSAINQSLMAALFGQKERTTILGTVFSVRNAAIVLGSMLATVPVMLNSPALYQVCVLFNAASFIGAAVMLSRMRATAEAATGRVRTLGQQSRAPRVRSPLRSPSYLLITLVNAVLLTHNTILTFVLPLWVTQRTAAPRWALTALLAVNGVLAMVCQVPVNRRFVTARAASRASALAGVAIALACVAYAASGSVSTTAGALTFLLVAIVIHSAGECLAIASTPLSFALAPPHAFGRYLTFYNLGRVAQDLVGPVLLGSALLHSHGSVWWAVGAVVAVGGALPLLLRNPEPVWEPEPAAPDILEPQPAAPSTPLVPQGLSHADQ